MKVSIVTCFYNRDRYLTQTIESVLSQTYTDFEYILYSNGASDRCIEIAERYTKQDSRIRLIGSPANQGLAPAWKAAIEASQSKYFGTVDDDDLLKPLALEKTVAIAEINPEIGVVYTDYHLISDRSEDWGPGKRTAVPYSKDSILKHFMTFHFRLVRRSAYNLTEGVNPNQKRTVDYDLCLKLSEVTEFYHLPEILYSYRRHFDAMSIDRDAQNACATEAIEAAKQRRSTKETTEREATPGFPSALSKGCC